jgi:hypothetical protein
MIPLPLTPTLSREYFRSIIRISSAGEGDPNIKLLRKTASLVCDFSLKNIKPLFPTQAEIKGEPNIKLLRKTASFFQSKSEKFFYNFSLTAIELLYSIQPKIRRQT